MRNKKRDKQIEKIKAKAIEKYKIIKNLTSFAN
jgi:hypothetical protein